MGVIAPPSKNTIFEGSASLDHVVADFWKKVRFSPPSKMLQIGRKTHFFLTHTLARTQLVTLTLTPSIWAILDPFWALLRAFSDSFEAPAIWGYSCPPPGVV